jgi:hypothetical protein
MMTFTDAEVRAMHERAFTAFYDTLYTYASPGPARDRKIARKALSPPTGRCRS